MATVAGTVVHPMDFSLVDLCAEIQAGRITPSRSVAACFERIHLLNPALNALVALAEEAATATADLQTRQLAEGKFVGPLAGVPFAVKDLEDTIGLPTSYGTTVFKDNVATEDSVQVSRLKAAGAIVVGKTNTPIFGSTMFCKNLAFGATGNPWDVTRTSGGSSGGSASAVAARMMPIATAADGGGSIRIPACFVGAFGLKPSFGRVPMTEGRQFGMLKFVSVASKRRRRRCCMHLSISLTAALLHASISLCLH
jgi:Asp-tRNA(Asn)/Glu-tRNA(Gln) amidotransferase A subunit family amidase